MIFTFLFLILIIIGIVLLYHCLKSGWNSKYIFVIYYFLLAVVCFLSGMYYFGILFFILSSNILLTPDVTIEIPRRQQTSSSASSSRVSEAQKILNLSVNNAKELDIPAETEDPISLEPVREYFFRCTNSGIKHYYNVGTIQNYCYLRGETCSKCSICRDFKIEPQIYRRKNYRHLSK